MKKIISMLFASVLVLGFISNANAAKTLKCQTVLNTKADEVKMLKDFTDTVTELTAGSLKFEILPAGAVVGVKETLDAVDKGLIDCGFAWTHYWSGDHPAAMLFGSPVAGGGVGIDNIAFLSWFQYGGGKELYDQLWKEMGRDIKGFMIQPVGPEALGWFPKPIKDMADFRKYKFRTPPGIPGQTYKDIGIASVAMGGGDILPALEAGTIDAAEWCCPKPDLTFGFQKVLKHYYKDNTYSTISFDSLSEEYNEIQVSWKTSDVEYKIADVTGGVYQDNIDDCYKKMIEVKNQLASFFNIKPKKKSINSKSFWSLHLYNFFIQFRRSSYSFML